MSYIVLSQRKILQELDNEDFRKKFPEFRDYYKQYDRVVKTRKAQKRCTRCARANEGFHQNVVDRIRTSRELARKIKQYYGKDDIRVVNKSGTEVELVKIP